jgi:hypothetical protein
MKVAAGILADGDGSCVATELLTVKAAGTLSEGSHCTSPGRRIRRAICQRSAGGILP